MSINTLELSSVFQENLDKAFVQGATTGWMEPNAGIVRYNGGREVKIPTMSMDGLGAYDRDDGFARGSVTLSFESRTLQNERGRSFQIDPMDVDETNFVATVGNVLGEFQRTKVIPEVDAFRYAKIATAAIDGGQSRGYTPDPATILSELYKDITAMYEACGDAGLVITMGYTAAAVLAQSKDMERLLVASDFALGDVQMKVQSLDGVPIIRVPSSRLLTAYLFYDGKTAGQEAGGFAPGPDAKQVNWLITARTAPIAISKTDTVRIFDPMQTQNVNAWRVDYRKYHDLWILDNQLPGVFANIQE